MPVPRHLVIFKRALTNSCERHSRAQVVKGDRQKVRETLVKVKQDFNPTIVICLLNGDMDKNLYGASLRVCAGACSV